MMTRYLVWTVWMALATTAMACKSSPTAPTTGETETTAPGRRSNVENLSGLTTSTVEQIIQLVLDVSTSSLPDDAVWNGDDGWWSFTSTLPSGQTAEVEIQFQDASGRVQKIYRPGTTHRIVTRGEASGDLGTLTWNLVLTGVEASSSTVTVNGGGTVSSQTVSGTYQVNDVRVTQTGAYPESGTIVVSSNGVSVRVEFNGSSTVEATYTVRGRAFSFVVDLDSGAVRPV